MANNECAQLVHYRLAGACHPAVSINGPNGDNSVLNLVQLDSVNLLGVVVPTIHNNVTIESSNITNGNAHFGAFCPD